MSNTYAMPAELTDAELALARGTVVVTEPVVTPEPVLARPTLDPPGAPGVRLPAGFVSVKVLALFSSGDAGNGRANLDGIGWRRLAAANESAHVNLGLLAAAARMQGTATPVRHEADNEIHEIYVW